MASLDADVRGQPQLQDRLFPQFGAPAGGAPVSIPGLGLPGAGPGTPDTLGPGTARLAHEPSGADQLAGSARAPLPSDPSAVRPVGPAHRCRARRSQADAPAFYPTPRSPQPHMVPLDYLPPSAVSH